jgi:bacterial/archaeal transporter family-2 protein
MRPVRLLGAAVIGLIIPLVFTMNAAVGMALGNPRLGNALFQVVGAIVSVLIAWGGMSHEMRIKIRRVPLWLWLGGVIAASGVLGMAILIPRIGAGNFQTIIVLAGISSGLVISHYGLLSSPVARINFIRVAGIIIMAFGAALAVLGRIPFID